MYKKYYKNEITDQDILSIAPLWLDPIDSSWVTKIFQFLILIFPILIIFIVSIVIIDTIWFSIEPTIQDAANYYILSVEQLKPYLDINSIDITRLDLTLQDLPEFFDSSNPGYKSIYQIIYFSIIPFIFIFGIVWYSYIRYSE